MPRAHYPVPGAWLVKNMIMRLIELALALGFVGRVVYVGLTVLF
jgi:hypothetical protein